MPIWELTNDCTVHMRVDATTAGAVDVLLLYALHENELCHKSLFRISICAHKLIIIDIKNIRAH